MNSRITIQEELKALDSSLPGGIGFPAFSVPDGYFDGLSSAVMQKIRNKDMDSARDELAGLSPLLAGIPKTTPFSVPEGYFHSNMESLKAISSEAVPAVLQYAGKAMPYAVPSGYFQSFADTVLKKVKPQAKVISMTPRRWMRVAAAAMVAGIITISGIAYFSGKQEIKVDNPQWVAKKLKNVSDRELDEFVKNTDIQGTLATVRNKPARNADVKTLLKDVPDNELDAFLNEVPSVDLEASLN